MENTGKHNDGGLYRWLVPPFIIGLIALLLSCMAKSGRADAAIEGVDYAEVLSVAQASISEHLGANYADTYPYYVMIDYAAKNRVNVLFFTGQASVQYGNTLAGFPYDMAGYYVRVYLDDLHVDNLNTSYFCCFASLDDIVYCNYDVMYNGSVVKYAEEPGTVESVYLVNAPYLSVTSSSVYNALLHDSSKTDISLSEWSVKFGFEGQPMTVQKYVAENEYYVWLPSKDFMDTMIGSRYVPADVGNGMTLKDYDLKSLERDILTWQSKVGSSKDSVLYRLKRTELYNSDSNGERYDYADFFDIIESAYGTKNEDGEMVDFDLAGYYGYGKNNATWQTVYKPLVASYLFVSRMDSQLYTYVDDMTSYYGRYMVFDFFPARTSPLISEVCEDIQSGAVEDMNAVVNNVRTDTLKDAIQNAGAESEELRHQLSQVDMTLGAFGGDLTGSDLWRSFASLSTGITTLAGSVKSLSGAIGSVFAFFPVPVSGFMLFTMVAICIVAIIKAVK